MTPKQHTGFGKMICLAALTIGVAAFWSEQASAQDVLWAKRAGGFTGDLGRGIAVDSDGNAHVTGHFRGTADFNGTEVTTTGQAMFLAKYDANGTLLRITHTLSTTFQSNAAGLAIAVDADGNSYVTGQFSGSVDFGGTVLESVFENNFFVAKYDADGDLLWAKSAGGFFNHAAGTHIAVDAAGNVYAAGTFEGVMEFREGIVLQEVLFSIGGIDIFLAKYGPSGDFLWAGSAGGFGMDIPAGIGVTAAGVVSIGGRIGADAFFGGTVLPAAGAVEAFVAQYDTDGILQWVEGTNSSQFATGFVFAADADGNGYIAGRHRGETDFGGITLTSFAADEHFLAKYDPSGNVSWVRGYSGHPSVVLHGMALDAAGHIYLSGGFQGTAVVGGTTLVSNGEVDIFLAKYDAVGDPLWAASAGGPLLDLGRAIAVDGSENLHVTGGFRDTAAFGNIFLTAAAPVPDWPLPDIYVAKFKTSGQIVQVAIDVKPGSDQNPINLRGAANARGRSPAAGGVLPVAILSSEEFDAADVDVATVSLGDPALSGSVGAIGEALEDVDGDGLPDLVVRFSLREMIENGAIDGDTVELLITGETSEGQEFFGLDAVLVLQ